MPPALSPMGPNPDMDRMNTQVENIPMQATAVPNRPPIALPYPSLIPDN